MSIFSDTIDSTILGIFDGSVTPQPPVTNLEYSDWRCGDDLDPFGRDALPLEVFAQDVYHLLTTNKFALIVDPDFGFGLENYLGKQLPKTLAYDIETALRADDRCSDARCTVTKVAPGTPVNINGTLVTADAATYRLDLVAQVESTFLNLALVLTPSGVVKVF